MERHALEMWEKKKAKPEMRKSYVESLIYITLYLFCVLCFDFNFILYRDTEVLGLKNSISL
jgi:hypothetical protein